ncbi:unnamed protein product, partial [Prorocentrum cordatum]
SPDLSGTLLERSGVLGSTAAASSVQSTRAAAGGRAARASARARDGARRPQGVRAVALARAGARRGMARRPRGVPVVALGLLLALLRVAGGSSDAEGAGLQQGESRAGPDASTRAAPPSLSAPGDGGMCQQGRPDLCRDRLRDCAISSPFEACYCEDGYGAQDIKCVADSFGYSCKYTCCPAQVAFECGPFERENLHLLAIIGLSLLAFGTAGVFVTKVWIVVASRRSRAVWLSPEDRAVESGPVVRPRHGSEPSFIKYRCH